MRVHGVVRRSVWLLVVAILSVAPAAADASVGLTQIAGKPGEAVVTVYYPSTGEAKELKRGPFTFQMALDGAPARGNRRLIVISHGSGGSPWVHANLAQTLVADGFIVAMPAHRGDNYTDPGTPGPESWKIRPLEISHAIDAVSQDMRFQPLLALDKVGMYGMSAGGHTALSLAGGRWSPAGLTKHCEAHIAEDFAACVGLITQLRGNFLDGPKMTLALWVIRSRFSDATWQTHTDPRIAAIVAAVPYAADFDMASLATPRVPLALVTARLDKWLVPRFHSDAVLAACATCERLADFATGGHGALLSPLPPGLTGVVGNLLNDPPGFDRAETAGVDRKVSAFFRKLLLP